MYLFALALVLGLVSLSEGQELSCEKKSWDRDYQRLVIPDDVGANITLIKQDDLISGVLNGQTLTFYDVSPVDGAVKKKLLLLHGAAFNADTWYDLGTLHIMAGLGYRVVALNTGFGMRSLVGAMRDLDMLNSVVVSPSFSGGYSLPVLTGDKQNPNPMCGFVPVATGGAGRNSYPYHKANVATLIIHGERDRSPAGKVLEESLPCASRVQVIPGGGHPAYLDNPDLFHQLLYNFMEAVEC